MTEQDSQTKNTILTAVGTILREKGHTALTVEAILKQSGCDEIQVFMHFKSFRAIIIEYISSRDYWAQTLLMAGPGYNTNLPEIKSYLSAVFISHYRLFRSDIEMQQFRVWQLEFQDQELKK